MCELCECTLQRRVGRPLRRNEKAGTERAGEPVRATTRSEAARPNPKGIAEMRLEGTEAAEDHGVLGTA
jgi:hypothetical protein